MSPSTGPTDRPCGERMCNYAQEIREMGVIHVGDLVVNSDPSVIGEVLSTSASEHGL